MMRIVVVDFGTGNLRSVSKATEHVSAQSEVIVSRNPELIGNADRVILPGQGAMGSWFDAMQQYQLGESVRHALKSVPVLGICLGMQALLDHSEEDNGIDGLGIIHGSVKRFVRPTGDEARQYKIPHMGWNQVFQSKGHPLWRDIENGARFYFVHSFYADPQQPQDIAGQTDYIVRFASAVARENIFAVQFHPEKSHSQGLRLLENFIHWNGS